MEQLSAEYGWTPNQIKDQPVEDISLYWRILQLKRQLKEAEMKKNA